MKNRKKLLIKLASFLLATFAIVSSLSLTACKKNDKKSAQYDILSFNIRVQTSDDKGSKNWSNRKNHVVNYLKESGADVICLQEVTKEQARDLTKGLEGAYTVVYYERENSSNPEGLAVCYDDGFELIEQIRFWLSETPDQLSKGWGASYYRICVNLLLKDISNGVYLNVYDVHLDHQVEAARVNGLKLVVERAEASEYPAVIAGDFNSVKDTEWYNELSKKMIDCQANAVTTTLEGVTYHNWGTPIESLKSKSAIDFCFVSRDVTPIIFEIKEDTVSKNAYYSDHYAILSVISVEYFA